LEGDGGPRPDGTFAELARDVVEAAPAAPRSVEPLSSGRPGDDVLTVYPALEGGHRLGGVGAEAVLEGVRAVVVAGVDGGELRNGVADEPRVLLRGLDGPGVQNRRATGRQGLGEL